jgi:hypothetical protein
MINLLDKEKINQIDLSQFKDLILETEFRNYFLDSPGKEHYKLLGYISSIVNFETLLDIGTYKGCSALALALNPDNQVKSFDIRDGLRNISGHPYNVEFIIDNIVNEKYKDLVLSSKFIILDTDHEGTFEHEFYNYLKSIGYKGTLMLDDIKFSKPMEDFWSRITHEKYDISEIGHHSGTGLVIFN